MSAAPLRRSGHARMATLDRYLAREILLPFAAGLVFLTQVLVASQLLAQADVLLGSGVSAGDVVAVAMDLVPHFLGYVLPVSFLLGAVVGTARLADDREIVAMGAAGLGPARLVRVPLALGVIVGLLALWVGLVLEPAGLRAARLRVNDIIRKNVTSDVRAGVFFEDIPNLTVYAEQTHAGRWQHVLIADATDPAAPLLTLAETGRLEPAGDQSGMRLVLDRGEVQREELHSDAYVTGRYAHATITLGFGGALSERNRLVGSPFELGPGDIVARARAARDPAEARAWWTFLHRRLAAPAAMLAFALLAVPIAASRRGGRAFGYAATILVVVAYYAVLRFGEGLSRRGELPAWLGPNLPNLLFAALGAGLVLLMARRGAGAVR